ncbi:glycosyltransferase family 2 protein [Thermostilla marina]
MRTNVILVAYHSDRWITHCVESLQAACGHEWHLILVDNGGNNSLEPYVSQSNVTFLATPRPLGFAEANNFALVNAKIDGELVCFLNQDTVSNEDWLGACADCFRRDPSIGAVSPLITNYDGTDWDEAFRACARADAALMECLAEGVSADPSDLPPFIPVPEITAAAMVVRVEALGKSGPFDPIFGSYYEDYDLCRRIAAAGYRVGICTRGRVGHFGGSVSTDRAAAQRRARWITRNRVIYAARWKWSNRKAGFLRYMLGTFPRNTARSMLGRTNASLFAYLAGHLDVLRLLRRLGNAETDRAEWEEYLDSLEWRSRFVSRTTKNLSSPAAAKR